MKKIVTLFLALLCMTLTLAGCAGQQNLPKLEKAITMSEEELTQELVGKNRDQIVDAWGEPISSLFGADGEIYDTGGSDRFIIVYYDPDRTVAYVKVNQNAK